MYSYAFSMQAEDQANGTPQGGGAVYTASLFSTTSVLPVSNNSMGSHIGYSEVVEKRNDGSYTKYKFTNFDNGHMDEPAVNTLSQTTTSYQPYTSLEEERGKLLTQQGHKLGGRYSQNGRV